MRIFKSILVFLLFACGMWCVRKKAPYEPEPRWGVEVDSTGTPEIIYGDTAHSVRMPQQDIPWPSLADSPWPMQHHDPQHTGRSPYRGPQMGRLEWVSDPAEGSKLTTLVLIDTEGNLYYIVTCTAYPFGDRLISLTKEGEERWVFQFPPLARVDSRSAVITSDGVINISCGDGYFYAVNSDGTLKHKHYLGIMLHPMNVGLDGCFYGTTGDGTLYALGPEGNIRWTLFLDTGFAVTDSPAFSPDGATIYLPGHDKGFYAISTSGSMQWYNDIDGHRTRWSYLVDNQGHIYVNPEDGFVPGQIYCLNPDGTLRWKNLYAIATHNKMTMDRYGFLYVADASNKRLLSFDYDGEFRWGCSFPGSLHNVNSDLICDADGTVYLVNSAYTSAPAVIAIDSQGELKWSLSLPQELFYSTDCEPTIGSQGSLYFTADVKKTIFSIK
jgi:outer membrane protein assembly factor BamB